MIRHLILAAVLAGWTFPQTAEVALRQITFTSEQEAKQVRAGFIAGASFEAFSGARYLGRMRLSDLRNEVREAVQSVSPGGISNPVRVGDTYVLFQVVPEAESRWIDLDEAGAQALAAGRNAEATEHLEQALAYAEDASLGDARIARTLDTLADVYRLQERYGDSEKLYRRALALLEQMGAPDLEIAQVLNGLGMTLVKLGHFLEAEPIYARVRGIRENRLGRDHPEVAAALHNTAELFAGLGRFSDAAKLYEEAQSLLDRTLGPSHPAAAAAAQNLKAFRRSLMPELVERLSKAAGLSDFHDAELAQTNTEIRELLPLAPLSEQSYVQIKNILLNFGLSGESEDVLRTGLKKFPESRLLRIHLAGLLAETGRTQIALVVLEEAVHLPPADVDAATNRQQRAVLEQRIGDMQLALTNVESAVAAYGRSLELDPAIPASRTKLGKALFSSGRLQEAMVELQRAAEQTPGDSEVHLNLSEIHLSGGNWQGAAAEAERAIELGVSDPRALYLSGTALIRMGRRDEGQARLQEFARLEADFEVARTRERNVAAINTDAIAALHEGNGDAAIERLMEGIARYPDQDRLRMNLAIIQSRLGRHQMAIETLEAMLERHIGRGFLIHQKLAEIYTRAGDAEAGRQHRKIYLDTRETELIVDAQR
jgi:tetratricopeptide (TPR) repeat protein